MRTIMSSVKDALHAGLVWGSLLPPPSCVIPATLLYCVLPYIFFLTKTTLRCVSNRALLHVFFLVVFSIQWKIGASLGQILFWRYQQHQIRFYICASPDLRLKLKQKNSILTTENFFDYLALFFFQISINDGKMEFTFFKEGIFTQLQFAIFYVKSVTEKKTLYIIFSFTWKWNCSMNSFHYFFQLYT